MKNLGLVTLSHLYPCRPIITCKIYKRYAINIETSLLTHEMDYLSHLNIYRPLLLVLFVVVAVVDSDSIDQLSRNCNPVGGKGHFYGSLGD